LEAWLAERHGWYELNPEKQRSLPKGRVLFEIDARLNVLFAESQALLKRLPGLTANTPAAIAAKLEVASKLIWPADHPEAHRLIVASVQDVIALAATSAVRVR
jgi:hypothetical protein